LSPQTLKHSDYSKGLKGFTLKTKLAIPSKIEPGKSTDSITPLPSRSFPVNEKIFVQGLLLE